MRAALPPACPSPAGFRGHARDVRVHTHRDIQQQPAPGGFAPARAIREALLPLSTSICVCKVSAPSLRPAPQQHPGVMKRLLLPLPCFCADECGVLHPDLPVIS